MAVSENVNVTWSPLSSIPTKNAAVPVARFIGTNALAGDGSGGSMTTNWYLNDDSASKSDPNTHYVLTELGYYVVNTGVSYIGWCSSNVASMLWYPEGMTDAGAVYYHSAALLDNGTTSHVSFRDIVYLGHEIVDTDAYFSQMINTNTNTKVYMMWCRGYKFKGFPVIKRDSFWI